MTDDQSLVREVLTVPCCNECVQNGGRRCKPTWRVDVNAGGRFMRVWVPACMYYNRGYFQTTIHEMVIDCVREVTGIRLVARSNRCKPIWCGLEKYSHRFPEDNKRGFHEECLAARYPNCELFDLATVIRLAPHPRCGTCNHAVTRAVADKILSLVDKLGDAWTKPSKRCLCLHDERIGVVRLCHVCAARLLGYRYSPPPGASAIRALRETRIEHCSVRCFVADVRKRFDVFQQRGLIKHITAMLKALRMFQRDGNGLALRTALATYGWRRPEVPGSREWQGGRKTKRRLKGKGLAALVASKGEISSLRRLDQLVSALALDAIRCRTSPQEIGVVEKVFRQLLPVLGASNGAQHEWMDRWLWVPPHLRCCQ